MRRSTWRRTSPGSATRTQRSRRKSRPCSRACCGTAAGCPPRNRAMWEFEQAPPGGLPDLTRFLGVLNDHAGFFAPDRPLYLARAPGRLDVMGGIADYSGALVLQLPLALATRVAAQLTAEPVLVVCNPAHE